MAGHRTVGSRTTDNVAAGVVVVGRAGAELAVVGVAAVAVATFRVAADKPMPIVRVEGRPIRTASPGDPIKGGANQAGQSAKGLPF